MSNKKCICLRISHFLSCTQKGGNSCLSWHQTILVKQITYLCSHSLKKQSSHQCSLCACGGQAQVLRRAHQVIADERQDAGNLVVIWENSNPAIPLFLIRPAIEVRFRKWVLLAYVLNSLTCTCNMFLNIWIFKNHKGSNWYSNPNNDFLLIILLSLIKTWWQFGMCIQIFNINKYWFFFWWED
jgi:hypothetical protein